MASRSLAVAVALLLCAACVGAQPAAEQEKPAPKQEKPAKPAEPAETKADPPKTSPPAQEAPDDDDLLDEGLDDMLGGEPVAEPTGEGASAVGRLENALKAFKGFIEVRPRVYLRDRDAGKNDGQLLVRGELELELDLGGTTTAYLRPRLLVDALDGDLKRFEPFEAYITFAGASYDVRVGQFVENWGIVDTFNPVDVLNRRDLGSDFLDTDRLGELGARFRVWGAGGETIGEPTLSVYAMPVWRDTLFPPEDQRFSFDTRTVRFDESQGFEPDGFERAFFAARVQATLTTAPINADVQLILARGPARQPTITAVPNATLAPVYFGATTWGAGIRAVPNQESLGSFLASLTLKAEFALQQPYRFDSQPVRTPEAFYQYVVGVDRFFYNVFREQDSLMLTVEYAGERGANDINAIFRPFANDMILRFFWEANDFARTSIELRGIYDFDHAENIIECIIERQLRFIDDDLRLIVQGQFFDPPGRNQSLFDFFPNNSSISVGLRLDF